VCHVCAVRSLPRYRNKERSIKGFAFVEFESLAAAQQAYQTYRPKVCFISLSFSLSLPLSVSLSLSLCISLYLSLSMCLSINLSLNLFLSPCLFSCGTLHLSLTLELFSARRTATRRRSQSLTGVGLRTKLLVSWCVCSQFQCSCLRVLTSETKAEPDAGEAAEDTSGQQLRVLPKYAQHFSYFSFSFVCLCYSLSANCCCWQGLSGCS
jgi:hypothetical protein